MTEEELEKLLSRHSWRTKNKVILDLVEHCAWLEANDLFVRKVLGVDSSADNEEVKNFVWHTFSLHPTLCIPIMRRRDALVKQWAQELGYPKPELDENYEYVPDDMGGLLTNSEV